MSGVNVHETEMLRHRVIELEGQLAANMEGVAELSRLLAGHTRLTEIVVNVNIQRFERIKVLEDELLRLRKAGK